MLRKNDVLMSKDNVRIREKSHEHGAQVPRHIKEAKALDRASGSTFWRDITCKEIEELRVSMDMLENGQLAPKGNLQSSGHSTFDAKMGFTRKVRWVLNGYRSKASEESACAGVILR